jgi:hypothetical protein
MSCCGCQNISSQSRSAASRTRAAPAISALKGPSPDRAVGGARSTTRYQDPAAGAAGAREPVEPATGEGDQRVQIGCRSLGGISDHTIRRMKPMLNISFAWKVHPALLLVGRRLCAVSRCSPDRNGNAILDP